MAEKKSPTSPLTAVGPAKKGDTGSGIENVQNFLTKEKLG